MSLSARALRVLLVEIESLAEALNLTRGVDDALRARIERMTLVAHIDSHRRARRSSLECVPTGARDGRVHVLGVDSLFHD